MRILVLGGTGVISRAIIKEGLDRGHEMIAFNRGTKRSGCEKRITTIIGDRTDREDFAEKMKDLSVDVVIDMISYDDEDARQTVEVFRDKAKQLIFTSSTAAYKRPYHTLPIREAGEEICDDPSFPYAYKKGRMEKFLSEVMREGQIPVTIIRPSLTFGEGCANIGVLRQNYNIVHRIRNGKPLVLPGDGVSAWSFTFAPDLAKGYLLTCLNPAAYNECFHITNTEQVLWEDLYRVIGRIVGIEPKFVYVPSALLNEADPSLFAHFYYEKKYCHIFSNEKICQAAPEYAPAITLEQGMRSILQWWEREAHEVDEEKDRLEDRICEAYERFRADLCRAVK